MSKIGKTLRDRIAPLLFHPHFRTVLLALLLGLSAMAMVMGPRPGPWNWTAQETEKTLTQIPGYGNDDGKQGVYLHWQFHQALSEGNLNLRDTNQLHPIGTPRPQIDGGNRLEMLLSTLLRRGFEWPSWMTWTVLLWIPINTLAFLPLGLRLWKRRGPAIAAGITWTLMPAVIEQMAAGRLTQVCMVGIPLTIAGLLGVVEEGRKKDIWMAGLGMALTAYGYWFYALFLVTLSPLFILHGRIGRFTGSKARPLRPMFLDLLKAAGITLAFVLPLALHVFWPALSGEGMPGSEFDVRNMPLQFADALQLSGPQTRGTQYWFPFVLIPFIALSIWKGQRRLLWILCGTLCIAFALGPAQSIGPDQVKMPYYPLWRYIPGYARMTHPERWLLLGGIFWSIAATDGIARWCHWGVWILPIGVLIHLWSPNLNGYAAPPRDTNNRTASNLPMANSSGDWSYNIDAQFWRQLRDPDGGAIMVVPLLRSNRTCVYQPFHGRPLLGGMNEHQIVRLPETYIEYFEQSPLLMSTWALGTGEDGEIALWQEDLDRLRADGFDTIVFHTDSWNELFDARHIDIMARLEAAFGEPSYSDDGGAIFSLPTEGRSGTPPESEQTIRPPERDVPMGEDDTHLVPEGPPPMGGGNGQHRRGSGTGPPPGRGGAQPGPMGPPGGP